MPHLLEPVTKRARDLVERRRMGWPDVVPSGTVTVLSVNYNTLEITLQMLFSLHRVLDTPPERVIIVDNGSTDGSREFLAVLADADLVRLIENDRSTQHGPGLNRGMREVRDVTPEASLVWVLDSDVFVARGDALSRPRRFLEESGAALIGPMGAVPQQELPSGYAHVSCLLLDPRRVWQRGVAPFQDDGRPGVAMQYTLRRRGIPVDFFPFYSEQYAVHLGNATLRGIVQRQEREHKLFSWAVDHQAHHYNGNPDGPLLHSRLIEAMNREVPDGSPERFVEACRREERVTLLP